MKNPLIPMVAITGKPTKEEIEKIMQLYSQAGIQQFLIYPRSGCEIEYMSEQWLEVCGYIIEAAKREKMDIWLYDEYNWPSGTCKGKVMQENNEFYAKSVFVEDGKCIVKKYDKYLDILNSDAVECFIKNTHEVYYKHFGKYFGSVIKGIFTDEPDISACTWNGGKYPYTKNLDIIYKEKCGRDLFDDMLQATPSEEFNCAYWTLLGELFRTNFLKKINDWCVSHTSDEKVIQETAIHNIENVVFDIKLNSRNTLRCALNENNTEFIFNAEDNFSAITLAVRNYHFDGEITLDGIKVEPKNQCKELKKGLNELYLSSDEFELRKGRHIITINKPSVSEFYLPSCFICGDFAADKNNNIRRLPETVSAEPLDENVLPQYSGSISYEAHIKVPDENCSIRFESSELYTELYINDYYLGGQWADYCWDIPSKYLGTNVKIKIIQYTSIGPMFGSAENCVKLEDYGEIFTEFSPGRYQKTGITDLKVVKRNEC